MLGCCALLVSTVMLVSIATTELPSNLSKRDLGDFPAKARLPPALSSSSQRSENPRRRAHPASGARHPVRPGRHDNASSIAPTPSLSADGGSGNLGDSAHGIHLLLRPPDLLTPSQMPPIHGHGPPTPAPPTLVAPEDLYPAHSAEVDWGSGDYLETLTFMGSEGEEFSMVTTLPSHGYDPYDDDDFSTGVSYNTAFPSRPVPSLSSRVLLPSVTVGFGTSLRTAHPTDPRLPQAPDSTQDSNTNEDVDFDWAELYPIEPTEMLLPDMNSMEYYNTLQAKENASTAGNRTHPPTHPHIKPTATHPHPAGPTHPPMPSGASVPFAKAHVKEILRREFNRSVELQVLKAPPNFVFRAVSGPLVYTAVSVINALRQSARSTSSTTILSVTPIFAVPDYKYQVHSLQFVPSHVDVRVCSFSERVERGLLMAYGEVRRRSQENGNFTVHIVNITISMTKGQRQQKTPVEITFAIRDSSGFLKGSDVSAHLRQLNVVEFSFYLGFPAIQIAEIVRGSRMDGADNPLELVYFVEGVTGERLPAQTTASMLNRLSLQRAAIVLGYRVHGQLATVEKLALPPSETQPSNVWLIIGVVVPVVVVILIIIILYWKLCRSEKLEFQPDAMSTIQQRQKLQAPSVKGFDFAKLHLGQHSKDDIMVIQEPAALPQPVKEATPSEGGELNTPKSKSSSTKASRAARRRGLSPSDGDSLGSEASSGRESAEESTRPAVTPSDSKPHHRKSKHAASGSGVDEQLSSSSIFEHVDRLSRGSSDGTRRVSNKIQLIAMQPMPSPPPHSHNQALSPALTERVPDGSKVNSEIQVALRHKSEIEHHRNKIRLRAKRKGHYDFPSMEDIMAAFGDTPEQQRVYQQAQEQIHKILHPDAQTPSPSGELHRSRGRRSPRQRQRHHLSCNDSLNDKDRLITDGDATYRKYPGVNNVAYVSDADQLPDASTPSPTDEVFVDPGSPPSGPAPAPPSYVPPQPSIEEARQQMHSLLDDAFALVSPSSQGSSAPLTLTGVTAITGVGGVSPVVPSSPPPRPVRQWGSSSYPAAPAHSPFSALQSDPGYTNSGQYVDELPSSSRPRPVGGSTAQLHQLTQVGLSSRIAVYPGVGRSVSGPSGSSWAQYRSDEEVSRPGASRETILSFPEYSSSPVFQMPRTSLRDPLTPQAHLDPPTPGYSGPEESSPSPQSSASLIKAIREELQRLSQKQAAVVSYHS
uniref:Si:dkeyp-27e10.3 n=1 Tax=Astyanax mexicanus TaxID=7994 RepID=W5KRG9_ASTMX